MSGQELPSGKSARSHERILRRREVEQRLGVSRSTIYEWVAKGILKAPIRIGPRAVGWPESWIEEFIRERMEAA